MRLLLAALLASLIALAFWYGFNRPQAVEPAWDQPLASVSFAPYRPGQSPITQVYPSDAEVEEDVRLASRIARSLRTYASGEGMERVLQLAGRYELTVTHGAWLETEGRLNDAEVELLIRAANAYPKVVERVIVGNEVLLRGDLTPDQLVGYIREVRAAVQQPVSYADVWGLWLKYPEIADEVDFITIHILPYWEDEPVAVEDVERHILKVLEKIEAAFPGKPVFIGEIGWPTAGRNRGPAVVGVVPAATLVRTVAKFAQERGLDYNIIEAFDQEWKSVKEGTVGGNWGLYTADRQVKIPLAGPVTAVPDWPWRAVASMVLGWLLFGIGMRRLRAARAREVAVAALMAQGWGALVVHAGFNGVAISYTGSALLAAAGACAVLVLLAALAQAAAVRLLVGDAGSPGTLTVREVLGALWPSLAAPVPQRFPMPEILLLGYAVVALISTGLLVFDGRYRDVPLDWYLVPVAAILLLAALRLLRGSPLADALAFGRMFGGMQPMPPAAGRCRLDLVIAVLLLAAAIGNVIGEGCTIVTKDFLVLHPAWNERLELVLQAMAANREILAWSAMLVVLALPFGANVALLRRRPQTGMELRQPAAGDPNPG